MLRLLFLLTGFAAIFSMTPCPAIEQPKLQSMVLYYSPRCPHSQKVLSYIKSRQLAVPLNNVLADKNAKEDLKRIGGHAIVPCLVVNGTPIYNDNVIISWLADHQDQLPHTDH